MRSPARFVCLLSYRVILTFQLVISKELIDLLNEIMDLENSQHS